MSDFNNIATFRLADADKINNLPADTNSELAGKADASHTHDDRYYTETETNSLLNGKQSVSEKGQPSGYASLDGTGKVPASQLPATVVDGAMSKSTYDTNDNGIVDNSEKLGGQLPSYYLDVDNHTDGTTNKVYTTTEKTKLAGIEAGAEVNTINSVVAGTNIFIDNTDPLNPIINASGGEGGGAVNSVNGQVGFVVLDTDDIAEGTTNKYLSATDKADLTDGGDSSLHYHSSDRDRANHTGTQAISTIDGLQTALNGKAALSGATFTGDITATNLSGTNTGDQDLSGYALTSSLATVATSGSYNDLSDKPSIPDNTDFVDLTTAQTVGGVKTFSSSPIVPTPTTDMEVATKKYVDDNSGGGGGGNGPILSAVIAGEITVGTVIEIPVSKTITAGAFRVSLKTLPTGADVIVKLYKNGVEDASVTIATSASATNGLYQGTDTTFVSGSYVEGDVLKASITQIGSTLAGTGLSILLNE